jgi:hypothetical protein
MLSKKTLNNVNHNSNCEDPTRRAAPPVGQRDRGRARRAQSEHRRKHAGARADTDTLATKVWRVKQQSGGQRAGRQTRKREREKRSEDEAAAVAAASQQSKNQKKKSTKMYQKMKKRCCGHLRNVEERGV